MKRKLFLFTLAALLFGYCGAIAQTDTIWTKYQSVTNKHLPDIPSSAEVTANGVEIGNMQALLLKKIEELFERFSDSSFIKV